jgi:hypothetical protein
MKKRLFQILGLSLIAYCFSWPGTFAVDKGQLKPGIDPDFEFTRTPDVPSLTPAEEPEKLDLVIPGFDQDLLANTVLAGSNKQQLLVFVIPPSQLSSQKPTVIPVNHDLLEGYAREHHLKIVFRSRLKSDIRCGRLKNITRFNDTLRPRTEASIDLEPVPDTGELEKKTESKVTKMKIWESPDGRRIKRVLDRLHDSQGFYCLEKSPAENLLVNSTRHAHFAKVPNRSKPKEANPGNPVPDTSKFLPADMHTSAH